ncbi:MAG: hypothetical protein HZB26_02905 [Candidatus Hydrogenedentes bacterium]|nr:hypothetical protein [Candidatus Hydrogenedentota bacterium]
MPKTIPHTVTHQLKSYIAPGAPATRTPCDGTEPDLRVEFGFTPRWYSERCGVDFSERWHVDTAYRAGTVETMRRELHRHFPGLRLSSAGLDQPAATLDGVQGALTIAQVFGIPVEYYPNNWPAAQAQFLTEAQIADLAPPDLLATPVFAQLMEQMNIIERLSGRIEGYINWQGVLNNALRIRGPEVLTDLMTDPPLAHHLFEVVARTMIAGMKAVYKRQSESGVIVRHATVSNCTVNMVSGAVYQEHLLRYDLMISNAFDHFGIHNCAWNVDPYIDAYSGIRRLGYVDMGLESDLSRAKELCPDTRRAVMYTPMDLASKSLEELQSDLRRIYRELGPCDVVMADIDHETPDERVHAFARLAEDVLSDES